MADRVVRRRLRRAVLGRHGRRQAAGHDRAYRSAGDHRPAAAAELGPVAGPASGREPEPRGQQARHGRGSRARIRSPASARTTGPRSSRPFRPLLSPVRPLPIATQPLDPPAGDAQPVRPPAGSSTQPVRAAQPPAGSRGRSRAAISADEDPLTSPAYSLRAKGSVDGRSRRPDRGREQYDAAVAQDTQAFSVADTQAAGGGYPDRVPPFRQFDRPAYSANGRGRSDTGPIRATVRPVRPIHCDRSAAHRSAADRSAADRSPAIRSYAAPIRCGPSTSGPIRPARRRIRRHCAYPYPRAAVRRADPASTPPYGERYGYAPRPVQPVILGERTAARSPGQTGGKRRR